MARGIDGIDQLATAGTAAAKSRVTAPRYRAYWKKDRKALEVERELGVSDWIDPETSAPAEDSVPHIEEH